jgi:hypothetical protein
MMENLQASDLANKINTNPEQIEGDNANREDLANLLSACNEVYRQLESGKYESNSSGYVNFYVHDSSDDDYGGVITKGVVVYFNDPYGMQTKLGKIMRSKNWHKARAEAFVTETKSEVLYPGDERWDVVVGSLMRAVHTIKHPHRDGGRD